MRELGERDVAVRSIILEWHHFFKFEVDQVFGLDEDPKNFMGRECSIEYQGMKLLEYVIVRLAV